MSSNITKQQAVWVLGVLSELIDYHEEADTERADEIAADLIKVFDLVAPLLPSEDERPVLLALSTDHAATLRRVMARAIDRAVTPEQRVVFVDIYDNVLDAHAAARRADLRPDDKF
jgi:hypothetical protein